MKFKSRHPDELKGLNHSDLGLHFERLYSIVAKLSPIMKHQMPKVVDSGEKWYVEYYAWDQRKEKYTRQRVYRGLNSITDLKKRRRAANKLKKEIYLKVCKGENLKPAEAPKAPEKLTVGLAFDTYLLARKNTIKESSYRAYKQLKGHLDDAGQSSVGLGEYGVIQASELLTYFKSIDLANKTCNNLMGNLKTFFKHFVDLNHIEENPVRKFKKLTVTSGKHTPFNHEEAAAMKAYFKEHNPQCLLFFSFLFYTLARPKAEIRLLKIGDIKKDTILIIAEHSKNRKAGSITIPGQLEELIQEYNLRSYPSHYYVFGYGGKPGLKPTGENYFYKQNKAALKATGLEGIKEFDMYSWKHTGVCWLSESGADLKDIQMQCRHSSIGQTDIYLRDLGLIKNNRLIDQYPTL
jgi:integrase